MALETAVRTEGAADEDAPERPRWRAADVAFLAFFIVFTLGSLVVLAQGLGPRRTSRRRSTPARGTGTTSGHRA
jgi:hypothetical protein